LTAHAADGNTPLARQRWPQFVPPQRDAILDAPYEREGDIMQRSSAAPRGRGTPVWRVLRVLLVAAALIASGTAIPAPLRALNAQAQKQVREDLVRKLTGKKIRVDKQTGQPRAASEAEARATVQQLTALLEQPAGPPAVSYRSNGMQVARVDGYLNRVVVGRPLPDGRFETRCVSTLDEAVAFLGGDLAVLEDR